MTMVIGARFAAAAFSLALTGIGPAMAQSITEFGVPTAKSGPAGIATGPDGALWFVEASGNKIGRITTTGSFSETAIQTASSQPQCIATGSDGNLWFTEGKSDKIGRLQGNGAFSEFVNPNAGSFLQCLTPGPDGNLWFTDRGTADTFDNPTGPGRIGLIDTAGVITEFMVPTALSQPSGIAAGPDGALWFTESHAGKIGHITTAGGITEFSLPSGSARPSGITAGPDGAMWFTETGANKIGRIAMNGAVSEFGLPGGSTGPSAITMGSDGALWFTLTSSNQLGRISTTGVLSATPIATAQSAPTGIVSGPDGALWFTENGGNKIGTMPPGTGSSPLAAAVLPSSRSVEVAPSSGGGGGNPIVPGAIGISTPPASSNPGSDSEGAAGGTVTTTTATVFAVMVNGGTEPATGCAPVPVTTVPASFFYQTTNPTNNALAGSPNTPATIPAGGLQTFVIAFTPVAPVGPTNVVMGYHCDGIDASASFIGLNTMLLSISATPVPDMVALILTASGDGIIDIPGNTGTGAFVAASVNVGAGSAITVSTNTGAATLPVNVTICQTNPATGVCLAPPAPAVTSTIGADGTAAYGVFVNGLANVPFSPAGNRIYLVFSDPDGTVRGSASVAVRTQ
jgi:virginiamycin B lyase